MHFLILGLLRPLKEYYRCFATWGDHTSMLGSGYPLYTVKTLYSKDIYYTDKEMLDKFNRTVNVQSLVEQPQIFLIGQCADSIEQKLSYVATRMKAMEQMASPLIVNDVLLKDEMRFFIGMLLLIFKQL